MTLSTLRRRGGSLLLVLVLLPAAPSVAEPVARSAAAAAQPVAPALAGPTPLPEETAAVLEAELLLMRGETGAGIARYLEIVDRTGDRELAARAAQLAAAFELPALRLTAAKRWVELAPQDDDARRLLEEARLHQGEWPAFAREASERIRGTEEARRGEAIDAAMLRFAVTEDAVAATQAAARVAAD